MTVPEIIDKITAKGIRQIKGETIRFKPLGEGVNLQDYLDLVQGCCMIGALRLAVAYEWITRDERDDLLMDLARRVQKA